MPLTSAVPGAAATLLGYMNTVAAASTVPDVQVIEAYSQPIAGMPANYIALGDYTEGFIVSPELFTPRQLPGTTGRRNVTFSLLGHIRTWAGGWDVVDRLADNRALSDALLDQILNDVRGAGTLSASGSWGAFESRMVANGPLGDAAGWGVVFDFELSVINAQLIN